jgi:phosphohistidine phosphatase SixA
MQRAGQVQALHAPADDEDVDTEVDIRARGHGQKVVARGNPLMHAGGAGIRRAPWGLTCPLVTLYLVRHANAGTRASWSGADDAQRPLSDKGRAQAEHFAEQVAGRPIRKLWSSPALRCVQTLEPLAATIETPVKVASELAEGSDPDDAIAFLIAHARHDTAFCSHGDLIPKVIRRLAANGMRTTDPSVATKGSWWVLEVTDGRITRGTYVPHASPD